MVVARVRKRCLSGVKAFHTLNVLGFEGFGGKKCFHATFICSNMRVKLFVVMLIREGGHICVCVRARVCVSFHASAVVVPVYNAA